MRDFLRLIINAQISDIKSNFLFYKKILDSNLLLKDKKFNIYKKYRVIYFILEFWNKTDCLFNPQQLLIDMANIVDSKSLANYIQFIYNLVIKKINEFNESFQLNKGFINLNRLSLICIFNFSKNISRYLTFQDLKSICSANYLFYYNFAPRKFKKSIFTLSKIKYSKFITRIYNLFVDFKYVLDSNTLYPESQRLSCVKFKNNNLAVNDRNIARFFQRSLKTLSIDCIYLNNLDIFNSKMEQLNKLRTLEIYNYKGPVQFDLNIKHLKTDNFINYFIKSDQLLSLHLTIKLNEKSFEKILLLKSLQKLCISFIALDVSLFKNSFLFMKELSLNGRIKGNISELFDTWINLEKLHIETIDTQTVNLMQKNTLWPRLKSFKLNMDSSFINHFCFNFPKLEQLSLKSVNKTFKVNIWRLKILEIENFNQNYDNLLNITTVEILFVKNIIINKYILILKLPFIKYVFINNVLKKNIYNSKLYPAKVEFYPVIL